MTRKQLALQAAKFVNYDFSSKTNEKLMLQVVKNIRK